MSENTKQKILDKTIEILGKNGIHNITVRQIASQTGVNIAAINYHFKNKDNLIKSALIEFLTKITDKVIQNPNNDITPDEMIKNLISLTEVLYEHPGIIKSIYFSIIEGNMFFSGGKEKMENIVKIVTNKISNNFPDLDIEIIHINIIQTISAVLYPILIGNMTSEVFNLDYTDKQVREKYIKTLVTKNFNFGIQQWKK